MTPVLAGRRSARYLNAVMYGCRTAIGGGSFALALALASGCGGAVEHKGDVPEAGRSHGGTRASKAGSSFGGSAGAGRAGASGSGGTVSTGGSLVDPEPVDAG